MAQHSEQVVGPPRSEDCTRGASVLTGCSQDSRSHTPVASRKQRDRREGHDHRGRGQTDPGRGTEGCSLGTFALTVNMNRGQSRKSPNAAATSGPPAMGHGPRVDS